MPELMDGAFLFGLLTAGFFWIVINSNSHSRRLPFWGVIAIGVAAAIIGPPLLALLQKAGRTVPFIPEITGGALFIGLWSAFFMLTLFERKGQPRRVPIWRGIVLGLIVALAFPPLIDWVTGAYQNTSLRADANACIRWTPGENTQREATNICDEPVIVGLCLPNEKNPAPCAQTATLGPNESASFDTAGTPRSSLPSNAGGHTTVACRPPHRPSRNLTVIGRGYHGVCLPGK